MPLLPVHVRFLSLQECGTCAAQPWPAFSLWWSLAPAAAANLHLSRHSWENSRTASHSAYHVSYLLKDDRVAVMHRPMTSLAKEKLVAMLCLIFTPGIAQNIIKSLWLDPLTLLLYVRWFLAFRPIGHKLFSWPGVVVSSCWHQQLFQPLLLRN